MAHELTELFARLPRAFEEARQRTADCETRITIDTVGVGLRFAGPALEPAVLPALAHLPSGDGARQPEIIFSLWDHASTGVHPPRPPFDAADYRRYGQRAVLDDGERVVMHAPTVGMLFAYDRPTRQGWFWCRDPSTFSIYERASPLQTLFHWALAEFGWQIVHAAAVGGEGGGVLLVGNTGAGKSTTALSCLAGEGLRLLSDDKCLVRLDDCPRAFGLFSSAKIKRDMLERLPFLRPRLSGWDHHFKADKGLVFLHPGFADRMVSSFPVRALLLPEVAHGDEPAIRPTPPGDVFRLLGPSTAIWLAGAEAENYRFTARMARRLPGYRFELAAEPPANVAALRAFLDGG